MWHIGDRTFSSRLLLGTSRYPSPDILHRAVIAGAVEMITVSLRRESLGKRNNNFWEGLQRLNCHILPNTAGCYSAKEAIVTAEMGRELFQTNWVKLEVIGDDYTLQPNPFALVEAANSLVKQGFTVLPYCTDDIVLCQRLVDCGCEVLMPLASPIGSGRGINNRYALQVLRDRFSKHTLIIDAGIGKPSHAAEAMELGFDAVLLNTAVAKANDPVKMATAFANAIVAGRLGFEAGCITPRDQAEASTPLIGRPFHDFIGE